MALNDFQSRSAVIHANAQKIVAMKNLQPLLAPFGQLVFTGSFALNLMCWNDLDLQLVLKEGVDAKSAFKQVFSHFLSDPHFAQMQVIDFKGDYKPKMPRGLYFGLNLIVPNLGGEWKIDLWALKEEDFAKNEDFMQQLKLALTPKMREVVLSLKFELMGESSRVPQLGSYLIYQAVLAACHDRHSILAFLQRQGVQVPS